MGKPWETMIRLGVSNGFPFQISSNRHMLALNPGMMVGIGNHPKIDQNSVISG